MIRLKNTLLSLLFISISIVGFSQEKFRDTTLSMDTRIKDLIGRLTFTEKVSMLTETAPEISRLDIPKYYHGNEALHGIVRPGKFTVFPQAIALAATWNPELIHKVATAASDEARGRWNELGLGKNQNEQYSDLLTFWSPTVNMARDPRWGRTPETYGEDPYLSGQIGIQFVKGLQGNNPKYLKVVSTPKHFVANNEEHNRFSCKVEVSERNLRDYYLPAFESCVREGKSESIMTAYPSINGVPCTANKHLLIDILKNEWGFNGYIVSDCAAATNIYSEHHYTADAATAAAAAMEAGLDLECGYGHVYKNPLIDAFAQKLVTEAQIDSAVYRVLRARMRLGFFDNPENNPYNKISPLVVGCTEHQQLALETARQSMVLLKNEDNFLPLNAAKIKSIAVVGINAAKHVYGDYSGQPLNKPVSVLEGLESRVGDKIKIVDIDWLSMSDEHKLISSEYFTDGLKAEYFDNPDLSGTPATRNDSQINFEPGNQAPDPFIPKAPLSVRWSGKLKPTVSGIYNFSFDNSDRCRVSIDGKEVVNTWSSTSADIKTEAKLEAGKEYSIVMEYSHRDMKRYVYCRPSWKVEIDKSRPVAEFYADAINAAKSCDITIAVLGINKDIEREGLDRANLNLPENQQLFIKEILKANPRTVVVLVAGSSLAINDINDNAPAILNAWYPGEQGGNAVAEVLFGDYNPAGRLPLTYYNSTDELPPFNDYEVEKGRTYQYFKGKPLYPFGYGLSYTKFSYKGLKIKKRDDNVDITFTVTNSGSRKGDEICQLYVHLPIKGRYEPIMQLKGFKRVSLDKGKSETITITVPCSTLRFFDEEQNKFVTPQGDYQFMIGSSSANIRLSGQTTL